MAAHVVDAPKYEIFKESLGNALRRLWEARVSAVVLALQNETYYAIARRAERGGEEKKETRTFKS
jgi:hypothetical protein